MIKKTSKELADELCNALDEKRILEPDQLTVEAAAVRLVAQEARIAELTTQEEIRKQLESETFEEYDWFYKLKFICRVLGNDGNAPKEDWRTAYGMARSLFDSAWLVQREKVELTKDAEPVATCPRIELVVAIHSLASDFENMSYSFGADTEDRKRAQGSIKHAMAVASKHNQNGAGCITHPPAPKAITADMVTDEMVDAVEDAIGMGRGAWDMVDHKELIAAACKTIGQAPIALALLTIDEVRTAYINANNDGFDFEGQLQKAFCKKNGLPHPTE